MHVEPQAPVVRGARRRTASIRASYRQQTGSIGRSPVTTGIKLLTINETRNRMRTLILTFTFIICGQAAAQDAPLRVGYAEADITPPLGGSMPGYFKDRKATGVLDPLKAKVVYLGQGKEDVALVACDLIGMGSPLVERIRAAVAEKTKSPPRHVFVHCTHTHTGGMVPRAGGFTSDAEKIYPNFYQGIVDDKWVDQLVARTADAVVKAKTEAHAEKHASLHAGKETTVAHYRRYVMKDGTVRTNPGRANPNVVRPAGQIDPRLHVLRCESNKVLIAIYGLHPDCVSGSKYSADYPHHMTAALQKSLGESWNVLFLNACCGNINHVDVNNKDQKSGPNESQRIGQALAKAALEALKKDGAVVKPPLRVASRQVVCKLRQPRPEDVKQAEELLRNYEKNPKLNPFGFNELFAPAALVLARTKDKEHKAEIGALRLGSFALSFMPGEIFVELGEEVEAGVSFRPTRTIGLTNGSLGYIPTRRGYAEGGYEAGYRSARYEPENGHRWAATAIDLLKAMEK
jgi:neutral ceramidase